MNLLEYQAKSVLQSHKISTLPGVVISSPQEVNQALDQLGEGPWVLKAQVLAGGRGKAGGIKVFHKREEVQKGASQMFGMRLVTVQTGSQGVPIKEILIEKGVKIDRELYVSVVMDRQRSAPVLIASSEGGVEIEKLAQEAPEKLIKIPIDPLCGLPSFEARRLAFKLGLGNKLLSPSVKFFQNLARVFLEQDCSLVEVNPLAVVQGSKLIALDAKISLDDNASFRHQEWEQYASHQEKTPAEQHAAEIGISYIQLDGNIGCLVNGAGLAMATMDIIKLSGGEPANFLDVGGGAKADQVTEAFKILLSDRKVLAVFVNIFGGIMRCDLIAEGILTALKTVKLNVPLVVRLEGNHVKEGKSILEKSGFPIIFSQSMEQAARKAVEAAGKVKGSSFSGRKNKISKKAGVGG